ncbi:MAG TPA: hypothetical protein VJ754_05685 [Anaerolineae bacterium]|nr:hypothetical protein [Anaerolineae bacterium]
MNKREKRRLRQCQCTACQHHPYGQVAKQHRAINRVLAVLNEKGRRRLAGLLASQIGRGGIQVLHAITGLSRTTIRVGRNEIRRSDRRSGERRAGGGRKATEKNIRRSGVF